MTTFALPTTETEHAITTPALNAPTPAPSAAAPAFCIDSDARADWLLRQLAALDAEAALLTRQHQAAVKRVNSDRESLLHLYGNQLEAYAAHRVAQDKRGRKSVILAHGTVAFRSVPAAIKINDLGLALHYARQMAMPNMISTETKETLDTARYQKAAQLALQKYETLLPGVDVTPAREAFSIRFGKHADED